MVRLRNSTGWIYELQAVVVGSVSNVARAVITAITACCCSNADYLHAGSSLPLGHESGRDMLIYTYGLYVVAVHTPVCFFLIHRYIRLDRKLNLVEICINVKLEHYTVDSYSIYTLHVHVSTDNSSR
jgi:hypothetical protein